MTIKCEDLIDSQLVGRQADFAEYLASEREEEPFAHIETVQITRVILSGGGPSDRIEIVHSFGEVDSVEYVYQDWFDGARREVEKGSPIWQFAEEYMEYVVAG